MNACFWNQLVWSAALNIFFCVPGGFAETSANRQAAPNGLITVVTYNYAEVSTWALNEAKKEAVRIFLETGVGIHWLDYPLDDPEAKQSFIKRWRQTPESLRLVLRILPRAMAERYGLGRFAFGFALPAPEGEFAQTANVFYHRAEELAGLRASLGELTFGRKLRQRMAPVAMILGHLIAHEIGHLLLGRDSHSRKGIMHVPWGRLTLEQAAWGRLLFTPKEAKRIRANVEKRTRTAQSAPVSQSASPTKLGR